jgi:DNA-binding PadR family transcriptional regulator
MRYRSSEKTIINLLTAIAENKEFAQYDMKKAIGKDYRTVLRYLPKLESCRLVQLYRTENSKKKGKDRKIYTITLLGIIELLKAKAGDTKDFAEYTNKMAVLHPSILPLVFGKWQIFNENQKVLLSLRLKDYVQQAPSHLNTIAAGNDATSALSKMACGMHDLSSVEREVTKRVLSDWTISIDVDNKGRLLVDNLIVEYFRALSSDSELRSYMDGELLAAEEEMKTKLQLAEKFNQWWKGLASSSM